MHEALLLYMEPLKLIMNLLEAATLSICREVVLISEVQAVL